MTEQQIERMVENVLAYKATRERWIWQPVDEVTESLVRMELLWLAENQPDAATPQRKLYLLTDSGIDWRRPSARNADS